MFVVSSWKSRAWSYWRVMTERHVLRPPNGFAKCILADDGWFHVEATTP